MPETFEVPVKIIEPGGALGTVIGAEGIFMGGNPAGIIMTSTIVGFSAPGPQGGQVRVLITGEPGLISVGGGASPGEIRVADSSDNTNIRLEAASASVSLGGSGTGGRLNLADSLGTQRLSLDGNAGQLSVLNPIGQPGVLMDGTGNLSMSDVVGNNTITFNALNARGDIGEGIILDGARGVIRVNDAGNVPSIVLDAANGSTIRGGLTVVGPFNHAGDRTVEGTFTVDGDIVVTGDILMTRADCAEAFEVERTTVCEPGTVMVLGDNGALVQSVQPYDRRVAGIVAGDPRCPPAIVLGQMRGPEKTAPLALLGRVFCKIDADVAPVSIGDLLTTSSTPGHAMKAVDRDAAFGAVIGKALAPLASGRGSILVLVSLQ